MSLHSKTRLSLGILAVSLLFACSNGEQEESAPAVQIKGATTAPVLKDTLAKAKTPDTASAADLPLAVLSTPQYSVVVHRAITFEPVIEDVEMFRLRSGYRYVVLDMSVKNVSASDLDMGQVLLSTKVRDEKGREYSHQSKAVAAYTHNNADPLHQARYNAVWGKIKSGEEYRTTIIGLEVPVKAKKLTLSMRDDGDQWREVKRYEAAFVIE